jgi:hypothetical protein
MLKQLAVLIFILAVAGQALAGVCTCLRSVGDPACCEKQGPGATAFSTSGCCGQNCLKITNDTTIQNRAENTSVVYSIADPDSDHSGRRFGPPPSTFTFAYTSTPLSFSQLAYKPPRELYLRNHTFRI